MKPPFEGGFSMDKLGFVNLFSYKVVIKRF